MAISAHPEMVSGASRCDMAVARATSGAWLEKVDVAGIYVVGIRTLAAGIAIKIAAGDLSAL